MKLKRRCIDNATITSATEQAKSRVEYWQRMTRLIADDANRRHRLAAGLCPVCYYESSRIGGAAITTSQCGLCDEQLSSGNTNIDVLCQACAGKSGLCKHCGADVNLAHRRKRELPEPTQTKECGE